MKRIPLYLHFDGHVLVGPCQLLVLLLEGGVAFDALLQLRFHLLRPFDVLPEIRGFRLKIFSCTAVDQIRSYSIELKIRHKGVPEKPFIVFF